MTEANTDLSEDDIAAYAMIAEKMFRLPVFYIEYSGTYGNPKLSKRQKSVDRNRPFMAGDNVRAKAVEMKQWADCIIVGNLIYEDITEALKTVDAVKEI